MRAESVAASWGSASPSLCPDLVPEELSPLWLPLFFLSRLLRCLPFLLLPAVLPRTAPSILLQHPQLLAFPSFPPPPTPAALFPRAATNRQLSSPAAGQGTAGEALCGHGDSCAQLVGVLPTPSPCQLSGGTQLPPDNTSAGGWEFALPPPLPSAAPPPTPTQTESVPERRQLRASAPSI